MRWREALRGRAEALMRPRAIETLPVRVDRHRIYVLPTRFGLFFAALLATMAAGALNYNNNPALLLALLLIGAGMASLVAAQLQLSGIDVIAIDATPVAAGERLRVHVHVRADVSRPRLGVRVDAADAAPERLDFANGLGDTHLEFTTEQRGWFELPRLRLSTTRPLGLARAWAYAWPEVPLLVYPRPEADGPAVPEAHGDTRQSRLHPAGDDVHHLRAYRPGDAPRAVAWKHSARRDALLVREYEQPLGTEVLLHWQDTRGLMHEERIARLARWVDDAERDGRRYRLVIPGQADLGPDQGTAHRHACLRALALMPYG